MWPRNFAMVTFPWKLKTYIPKMETKQTIDLLTNELMDKIWFPYN